MKRDFSSLSAQEALHVAIFVEERNSVIYSQFAELFRGFDEREAQEIADVFGDMAEEERQHGTELQERYFERYGSQPCSLTEEDIQDLIEVPQLSDGNIFAIARAGATQAPRSHALAIALKAEETALRFYHRLAQITDDAELCAFYTELSLFETDHVQDLRRQMELALRAADAEQA